MLYGSRGAPRSCDKGKGEYVFGIIYAAASGEIKGIYHRAYLVVHPGLGELGEEEKWGPITGSACGEEAGASGV
jgi:hypothetical protein